MLDSVGLKLMQLVIVKNVGNDIGISYVCVPQFEIILFPVCKRLPCILGVSQHRPVSVSSHVSWS